MTVFIKYSDGNYKFVPVAHTNSRSWPPSLKLCTSPPYRPQARFYLALQGSESQLGLIAGSVVCHLKGRIEMGIQLAEQFPALQRYSQSRRTVCRRTERSLEVVPASGFHSHPMGHFSVEQRNSGIVPGKAGKPWAGSFVNSPVTWNNTCGMKNPTKPFLLPARIHSLWDIFQWNGGTVE